MMSNSGGSSVNVTVNIYAGTGSGGTLLHSETIGGIDFSVYHGTVSLALSNGPILESATTYSFEFIPSSPITIYINSGNPYADGEYEGYPNRDLMMTTYMSSGGGAALFVAADGNVGIGTESPTQAMLVVEGGASNNHGSGGYLNGAGNTGSTAWGTNDYSIYATNRIACSEFNAFSDARIKNIQGVSNTTQDLQTLASIEITDYTLKDTISKGNKSYKKVIAQQIKEVYPQAVSQMTDVVPNIYKLSEIKDGWINLKTDLQVGDRVKLIFSGSDKIVEVEEISASGFKVASPNPSKGGESSPLWGDAEGRGAVFVYGKEVDDFHTVDYEAISMLNVSATQELLKRIESLETEKSDLKASVESLNNRVDKMESFIYQQAKRK